MAMIRADFIPKQEADKNSPHHGRALLASCLFHGLVLGLLVWTSLLYQSKIRTKINGSPASAPTISLSKWVTTTQPPTGISSAPPASPAPQEISAIAAPQPKPPVELPPPEIAVPVLALQADQAPATEPARISVAVVKPSAHPPTKSLARNKPNETKRLPSTAASSFAPGVNVMPHPDYPSEAQDLRETGTVYLNVEFDAKGNVAKTDVARSSGFDSLDSHTQTFIRARWHCPSYAGQIEEIPVLYQLTND